MDALKNTQITPKTTVFNLIILDESGSMSHLTPATLSGCNETINLIRESAKRPEAANMRQLVSIFAFQSGLAIQSRYLIKNAKPQDVKDVTERDYQPCGGTPLLDAVGSTLTELKAVAATHEDATGIITIITDGYENSSHQYSGRQVACLIAELKEMGWTINLIGAEIDVASLGRRMNIDNCASFEHTTAGTADMWEKFRSQSEKRYCEMACEASMPIADRIEKRKANSKGFFSK